MRKKLFFTIFTVIGVNIIFAQKSYIVSYEQTKDIGDKILEVPEPFREQVKTQLAVPEYFELKITGNEAFYKLQSRESSASSLQTENVTMTISDPEKKSEYYINAKNLTYTKKVDIAGKNFIVSGKLAKNKWKITSETKKIGNYKVQKATMGEGEEYVEAWFAPELPFQFGPEQYWGLPGLIIELKAIPLYYIATDIKPVDNQKLTPPTKGKKVTEQELEKIIAEQEEE